MLLDLKMFFINEIIITYIKIYNLQTTIYNNVIKIHFSIVLKLSKILQKGTMYYIIRYRFIKSIVH